ncbi:MAG: hypothetical protein AAF228_13790 [Pseudomonadota bacterium]
MGRSSDISYTDLDDDLNAKPAHVEHLLNSQAKLLNIQAEATQSFGKAISNLNTATEELIERVNKLPTEEDLIANLSNPIVNEVSLLSEQINLLDQKLNDDKAANEPDQELLDKIADALVYIKDNLQERSETSSVSEFSETAESIEKLREEFAYVTENSQKYTEDNFEKLTDTLHSLQEGFEDFRSDYSNAKTDIVPVQRDSDITEIDLGKERLQKVVIGFEILMRGLGKDIRDFRKSMENVEALNHKLYSDNVSAQNDENNQLLKRLSTIEYMVQSLQTEITQQTEHVSHLKREVTTNTLPNLNKHKETLQKTSLSFGIMLKNFSDDMRDLKTVVENLEYHSGVNASNANTQTRMHDDLNKLSQKIDDVKNVIEVKQTQDLLDNNAIKLQRVTSHIEQQATNEYLPLVGHPDQGKKLVNRFQLLLKEIKTITGQYHQTVQNIKLENVDYSETHQQHDFDDTIDKISSIVSSLDHKASKAATDSYTHHSQRKSSSAIAAYYQPNPSQQGQISDGATGQAMFNQMQDLMHDLKDVLDTISEETRNLSNINSNSMTPRAAGVSLHDLTAVQDETLEKVLQTITGPMIDTLSQRIITTLERSIQSMHSKLEHKIEGIADQIAALPSDKTSKLSEHKSALQPRTQKTKAVDRRSLDRVIEHLR